MAKVIILEEKSPDKLCPGFSAKNKKLIPTTLFGHQKPFSHHSQVSEVEVLRNTDTLPTV
jgi:hypothetical protein